MNSIKIADNLIFFLLLRVISVKEKDLYNEIKNFKKVFNTNLRVLKGFGRYDFIIVMEADGLDLLNHIRKNITNFLYECYPLITFSWINEKNHHIEQLDYQDMVNVLTLIK